jgi:DNA-directed RNA polymerase specialized sigma24 family protein
MDSQVQIQFTAYLQRALKRQRQRTQVRIAQRENHEQPLLGDDTVYQPPENDIITLIQLILSERERSILLWHVILHMSHAEISLRLGISVSAAEKAYQRILPKLRTQLEECRYAI